MDVVRDLFEAARAASLDQTGRFDLTDAHVSQLLSDPIVQLRLRQEFARLNDSDVRNLILTYLALAADRLEDEAKRAEDSIESLEWTLGFGSKITPVVGGLALVSAVIASAGVLGAAILFCAGSVSLIGVGMTRHKLKSDLRKARAGATRMRLFIADMGR